VVESSHIAALSNGAANFGSFGPSDLGVVTAHSATLITGQIVIFDFRAPVVNRFFERGLGGIDVNVFTNKVESSDVLPLVVGRMFKCTFGSCSFGECSQLTVPFHSAHRCGARIFPPFVVRVDDFLLFGITKGCDASIAYAEANRN